MTRVGKGGNRSIKKRAFGALAISSTGLLSTVALAATTSFTVLIASYAGSTNGTAVKWLEPIVSAVGLTTLTSATPTTTTLLSSAVKPTTTTQIGTPVKPAAVGGAVGGIPETKLGINLSGPAYYAGTRPFMNLMAGGIWTLIQTNGAWASMPADHLDVNKNVVMLNTGEQVARSFSIPTAAYRGQSVDINCRWQGKGTVTMFGPVVRNVRSTGTNSLSFTFVPQGLNSGSFIYRNIDPANPLRAIDCREKDADPNALFDPTFLAEVKRYSTMRFLKWMRSAESNIAVTWATRTKAGDGLIDGSDSVPVEYMVALANQTKVNPWFTLPWNADEEYVRNFATYVRDNLDPSLKAHVEVSNEVWNYVYPVTSQAIKEAKERGLTGADHGIMLQRYAQKTGEVMDIWSSVYSGQMSRLVRIAATQNSDWSVGVIAGYGDTAKKIDAIATAPYFSANAKAGQIGTPAALDAWFTAMLGAVDDRIKEAKTVKAAATKYGLRYITYEAGQHLLSPDDLQQMYTAQRDPRMGRLYTRYLTNWKDQVGDLMVLFADIGGISKYGAWGHQEYIGQPLSEAPKANAVELFRRSYVK